MVKIVVQGDLESLFRADKNKGLKVLLGIFRKACNNAGIPAECKRREFYESTGEKTRRKKRETIRERIKNQAKKNLGR